MRISRRARLPYKLTWNFPSLLGVVQGVGKYYSRLREDEEFSISHVNRRSALQIFASRLVELNFHLTLWQFLNKQFNITIGACSRPQKFEASSSVGRLLG